MSRYSRPPMVTYPPDGRTNPSAIRSVVVLPAPLGPRKPVIEPGSTVKLSRSTARMLPLNTLESSWTTICPSAGAVSWPGVTRPSQHAGLTELRRLVGSAVGHATDELQPAP